MKRLVHAVVDRGLVVFGRAAVKTSFTTRLFTRLLGAVGTSYKGRKRVLRYLGQHPYISPRAQVACRQFRPGARCFIDDFVTIYSHPESEGEIALGRNVHFYRNTIVELGPGNESVYIGDNTYIQTGCNLNAYVKSIIIGRDCMIAPRCSFMPYQHGTSDLEIPMRKQPLASHGDIILEDDVWLGVNVTVLDNVRIGQGAVVGAGAVVTGDIPAYAIAVGVPARVKGTRKPS